MVGIDLHILNTVSYIDLAQSPKQSAWHKSVETSNNDMTEPR